MPSKKLSVVTIALFSVGCGEGGGSNTGSLSAYETDRAECNAKGQAFDPVDESCQDTLTACDAASVRAFTSSAKDLAEIDKKLSDGFIVTECATIPDGTLAGYLEVFLYSETLGFATRQLVEPKISPFLTAYLAEVQKCNAQNQLYDPFEKGCRVGKIACDDSSIRTFNGDGLLSYNERVAEGFVISECSLYPAGDQLSGYLRVVMKRDSPAELRQAVIKPKDKPVTTDPGPSGELLPHGNFRMSAATAYEPSVGVLTFAISGDYVTLVEPTSTTGTYRLTESGLATLSESGKPQPLGCTSGKITSEITLDANGVVTASVLLSNDCAGSGGDTSTVAVTPINSRFERVTGGFRRLVDASVNGLTVRYTYTYQQVLP